MKRFNRNAIFPLLALTILVLALNQHMFSITSFGKVLDPFIGAVQNGGDARLETLSWNQSELGLSQPVSVVFDNRKVPHIFAGNSEDMYFAQGYVTAYLRLWQMDFLSYLSAGRLSEIFGQNGTLDYDRLQRRAGILEAARASVAMMEKDAETSKVLAAYTRGVNAYISSLTYKTMPLEYKFLNYAPEPWTNLKTALIMKYMANTLSGFEEDLGVSKLMIALGENKFNQLFPDFNASMAPIVQSSQAAKKPVLGYTRKPDYLDYSFISSGSVVAQSAYNPRLGSNSWVVSGKKTKSGFPILCNDPHLNLSLPAIWLEMQLSSPEQNVYGVSIPGTPAVIIGFNEHIAWGITNGADDVKDWYKLKITDDFKKYELDGKWLDLAYTREEIKVRGSASFYDTVYRSLHGPVMFTKSFPGFQPELVNHALRWELHNASNEFLCFIKLNKAKNYADYQQAIANFCAPLQNFTYAGKDGTIAVNHQGRLPVKWPGQGKFVLDGTRSSHLYNRYIPFDSLPQAINPASQFIVTANQRPTDSNYKYYYNGYFSEHRAIRIRQMLEADNQFDIEKMKQMQLDNTFSFANEALPVLLRLLQKDTLRGNAANDLQAIAGWKGRYDAEDTGADFFQLWWNAMRKFTWDEFETYAFPSKLPDDFQLLNLLQKDSSNVYFDKQGTTFTENAKDIVAQAYQYAVNEYEKKKQNKQFRWGDVNKINLMHLANIPAFSRLDLPSAGYPDVINAKYFNWGPSWRMVVELGERPVAYGIFAGGESGNIGSPYYDSFVNDWNAGKYFQLQFFSSQQEAAKAATTTWQLK
jgi:penicillin G amidase